MPCKFSPLSSNTQAILLLTAPLRTGSHCLPSEALTPGEYQRLARHLRDMQCQPGDFLLTDATGLLRACRLVIEENRLQRLLGRGFLLNQLLERWWARSIWVVSRADADYPRYLKARLRDQAPAVLYGCGDVSILKTGGLAVVGSRRAEEALLDYTMAVGRLAARSGRTIVSGGAKGVDLAAMRGGLSAGGQVVGVLPDSLEKRVMDREYRHFLHERRLVLLSPFDPREGFSAANALQRNRLIYAMADAALVVHSDLNRGGSWSGASEQLDKLRRVPIYVRSTGPISDGLDGLRRKGAIPWPNPQDQETFEDVLTHGLIDRYRNCLGHCT